MRDARVVRPRKEGDQTALLFSLLSAIPGVVGEVNDANEEGEALRTGDRAATATATAAVAFSAAAAPAPAAAALVLLVTVLPSALLLLLLTVLVLAGGGTTAGLLPLLVRFCATAGSGRRISKRGAPDASVSSR